MTQPESRLSSKIRTALLQEGAFVFKVWGSAAMMAGRKKPYTELGIRRLRCVRCGAQATHQWNACADDNLWRPICWSCDVALNRMVLTWMGFTLEEVEHKMKKYAPDEKCDQTFGPLRCILLRGHEGMHQEPPKEGANPELAVAEAILNYGGPDA